MFDSDNENGLLEPSNLYCCCRFNKMYSQKNIFKELIKWVGTWKNLNLSLECWELETIALQIGPQSVSCLDLDCWALGDLKIGLIIITVQRYKLTKSLRFFAKFPGYVKIFSSNMDETDLLYIYFHLFQASNTIWYPANTLLTTSGQSYKTSTIVNYDSGVVPD